MLIGRWYWWRVNAWSEISALVTTVLLLVVLHVPAAEHGLLDASRAAGLLVPAETPERPGDCLFGSSRGDRHGRRHAVWIAVTFLTAAREPSPRTIEFYRKLRVAGPGWARVARAAAIEPVRGEFGRSFLAWIISVVWLYSLLLAIGKLLLCQWTTGGVLLALSLVSGEALRRFLRRTRMMG